MTFQQALQGVLLRGTIRRRAWNGEKELYLADPCIHDSNIRIVKIRHQEYHPNQGLLVECRFFPAWLGMGRRVSEQRYWDGSPEDVAADDWECKPVIGEWHS